jgi:oxaloacetate decarboxylase alpha subunit
LTRIVDTTIRLLSQEPLVDSVSTGRLLEVAEILDEAGFAALEVTGGGCFDSLVARGQESPWERVRALRQRCRRTPLQMALRGRFLVGSRPLSDDLVRRFIMVAAESGIDIFRLHDPLNDVENMASAARAVREAGGRLYAGLAFSGQMANLERVVEKARRLAELGADHVLLHDPAGALDPGTCGRVVARLQEAAGRPVGLYCQGTGGNAVAMAVEAARNGAEPIAAAIYPVAGTLNRVADEAICDALTGLGIGHGVEVDVVWRASRYVDDHVTSRLPALPVPPRITLRAARHRVPFGLVTELDARLRAAGAADRLDEALDELARVRADCGTPPLAQPIGGILAGQALRHVLSARRWADVSDEMRLLVGGHYGTPPLPVSEEASRHAEPVAESLAMAPGMEELKEADVAASEEDLLLLALFGEEAERLLEAVRGRGAPSERAPEALSRTQSERIRELVHLVEHSDVGELTLEDGSVRITVRKQEEAPAGWPLVPAAEPATDPLEPAAAVDTTIKVESPMVGTFYRRPSPSEPPFVEEGDRVEIGQTLCVLEAMKLFNELKSDYAGTIRRVLVSDSDPVEFGQPLFELEPA